MRQLIMALAAVTCLIAPIVAQPADEEDRVPVPEGWTAPDQEYRYDPDNLWEYINGAAELFLTYGFRELAVRDIERGDQYLSVCVYTMSHPMQAFGIFEREAPAGRERLDAPGAGAILQAPYQAVMFKQRFYVKVEAGGGDVDEATFTEVLAAVAAGLPGTDDKPHGLELLPERNRLPGTIGYAGRDYLGFADLRSCLYADYEDPQSGQAYQVFAMRVSGNPFGSFSRQWHIKELDDQVVAWRQIPYEGVVVLRKTDYGALGIAGCDDRDQALALLQATVAD